MPSHRLNLTPAVLKSLPADGLEHHYSDEGGPKSVAGLAVRVRPSGSASFVLNKRVSGRLLRVTLGPVGALTLGAARDKARQTLAEITLTGESPNAAKRARRDRGVTLATAYADFLDGRGIKASTRESYDRMVRLHLSSWQTRPLVEITRADVRALYARLAKRTPASANLTMRLLRAVFFHAIGEYLNAGGRPVIVDNPVRELSRKRAWKKVEPRRARIATADLAAWWSACEAQRETSPVQVDFLRLLLLTGMRRNEAAPLRWTDVDLVAGTLHVAETKGGRPLDVPLSTHALDVLERRQGDADGSRFVFPGTGETGHIVEPKSTCQALARRSGVVASPHALRRTFVSVAESLDIGPYTIKALIGHAVNANDVTGTNYANAIEVERLRVATQRVGDAILGHASATAGANVVALRARA